MKGYSIMQLVRDELATGEHLTSTDLVRRFERRGVVMSRHAVAVNLLRLTQRGEVARVGHHRRYHYALVPTRSNLESILDAALRLDPEVARQVLEARGWRKVQR